MRTENTTQIAELAARTSECPCIGVDPKEMCGGCTDSHYNETRVIHGNSCRRCKDGRVVSFMSLRRVCPFPDAEGDDPPCPGWLPVPLESVDVGKLLAEIRKAGYEYQVVTLNNRDYVLAAIWRNGSLLSQCEAAAPAKAVIAAIHEALQSHFAPVDNGLSEPSD